MQITTFSAQPHDFLKGAGGYICIYIYIYIYCAELRSFRRGCMALRASEDNVWKQLSTTERFFKRCAGHCQKNLSKIIRKWNQNGPEILPKGVSGGHPSISGPTSDTGRISRPSREPCFAVSACLGDPLGTPRGPFGQPFRDLSPSGRAQDPKMDAFFADLFSDAFFTRLSMDFGDVPDAKTMDSVWEG